MIEIRNQQGDTLDLTPGQRLTIEQASTLMSDDELIGAFSYPISFPLNERNNRFLAYGYRPDTYRPSMELPVQVILEGHLYRRCTLSYRIQDMQGDGYLKIDSGELAEKWKKQTLAEAITDDIDLGIVHGTYLAAKMLEYAQAYPGSVPFTFFPIKNPKFVELEFTPQNYQRPQYMNPFGVVNSVGGFLVDTILTVGQPVVPQFYLTWVLERLLKAVGYRLTGDWIANEETQRLTIFNNTAITSAARLNTPFRIKPGLHLPDLSVGDFIKAIRQRYGLSLVFNANLGTCSIRSYRTISQLGKSIDLSAFQLQGYSIADGEQKGFSVTDYVDELDDLFRDSITNEIVKPKPVVLGKGGTPLDLKIGAPKQLREGSPFGGLWSIPQVHMAGNLTDLFYKDSDRFVIDGKRKYPAGFRLLSYRGLKPDNNGTPYPFATSDGLTILQQRVGLATALDGHYGLWKQLLRYYYQFRDASRKVTTDLLIPVSTLNQTPLDEPISLTLNDSIRSRYLISKLQLEAPGQQGKVKVRLEIQTMPMLNEDLAEMGYQTTVDTVVWVQIDVTYGPTEVVNNTFETITQQKATVTLLFFTDPAYTTPTTVENLTVNVAIEGWDFQTGPGTSVQPVVASGSSFVAFTDEVVFYKRENRGNVEDHFTKNFALDFGDGYNI